MPRIKRVKAAGIVQHVMNRGNRRSKIFESSDDYWAFMNVLAEADHRFSVQVFAYCVMPNHWHIIVRPLVEGELSAYMQWLTGTHVRRYHRHRGLVGTGHLYQARYSAIPIQTDRHLLIALRYVESNALRAKLVERAENWPWTSLNPIRPESRPRLTDSPAQKPQDWIHIVNTRRTGISEMNAAISRGRPFGSDKWTRRMVEEFGLEFTVREPGRPRKEAQTVSSVVSERSACL